MEFSAKLRGLVHEYVLVQFIPVYVSVRVLCIACLTDSRTDLYVMLSVIAITLDGTCNIMSCVDMNAQRCITLLFLGT